MSRRARLGEEQGQELFDVELKDQVDATTILLRQLERCNILGTQGDEERFARAVEVLMDDLPLTVKERVKARRREWEYSYSGWQYKWCGKYPMGTPEDPVTDAEGRVISPVFVEYPPQPDPYALLGVIKEELEKAGITWQHREEHKPIRKVGEPLPDSVVSEAEKILINYILRVRAENPELKIGWKQLLGELLQRTPAIPVLKPEEREEGEKDE